jgi:hypothetical protein
MTLKEINKKLEEPISDELKNELIKRKDILLNKETVNK